ncbi:MAG: TonB-dependent receptor [Flavobacteriales bacterium]|jgi:outer membrane receptor for ferrienterochelin and colicins|nr:TonB-dependent receptor [Flavobacteriales bacterium]
MRVSLALITLFFVVNSIGQATITGKILDEYDQGVSFANIFDSISKGGTSADVHGSFSYKSSAETVVLMVSAIGYQTKPVRLSVTEDTSIVITLQEIEALDEVVVSGTLTPISKRESPISIEVYSSKFIEKIPVSGLFEATQNINGVRPQINCAVCNTGDIHINGMEGPYTMITIDGMPLVGGLSSVYGLQGIPTSLIQQMEVVKGPASTLYGSQAVAGLINVITKNPDESPDFSWGTNISSWRELQTDFSFKYKLGKTVSNFGADYFNYTLPIDNNGDNFTDLTQKHRISLFNKIDFYRKKDREASILARYLYEDRWGGEMHWNPNFRGGDSIYGESIYTNRFEVVGKYQLPIKAHVIFSGSYSNHTQNSFYGNTSYNALQQIAYGQLVWDKNWNLKNTFVTGLVTRYEYYDDNTFATQSTDSINPVNAPNNDLYPGFFFQNTTEASEKLKVLSGVRFDYHKKHRLIFTPRLNFKYTPTPKLTARLGYGNGFRVVNVFTEDHAALTGARTVEFTNNLNPERSHNGNFNLEKKITTKWSYITLDASAFYTYFSNKIIPDYDTDPNKIIYDNLKGNAVSKGIALNARLLFEIPLTVNVGATIMDVYTNEIDDAGNTVKSPQLLTENITGTWAISYKFAKPNLSIDYTGNLYGPMHLPVFENDFRADKSPFFSIQNIKLTKSFNKGWKVALGVQNLLNFTPPAYSIMRAFDPFDKNVGVNNPNNYTFDAAYVYTSFQGITGFASLRYEFTKK